MKRVLFLGAGSRHFDLAEGWEAVRLDHNPAHKPDLVWDLEALPLPFDDEEFDQIIAVEVLEHLRSQGDWQGFFADFSEYWRLLKPNAYFVATVPMWNSIWAWGDPSHKRIISRGSLSFLDQEEYKTQIGKTPMSDFRTSYKADFDLIRERETEHTYEFTLRAVKPSRIEEP